MTFRLQGLAVVGRKLAQGAGCTLLDGAGLTCESATVNVDENVVLAAEAEGIQGSLDSCDVRGVVVQIVVTGTTVDGDRSIAGDEANTGYRGLATTGAPVDDGIVAHLADAEGLS